MSPNTPRVISVRNGQVQPSGSWLYVWVDSGSGEVAYVGGTGFDPELRAYLHVTSDGPQVGRVRAKVSRYDERDFDVLAFELAEAIDRSAAKEALLARLAGAGASDERIDVRDLTDAIVRALDSYCGRTVQESEDGGAQIPS